MYIFGILITGTNTTYCSGDIIKLLRNDSIDIKIYYNLADFIAEHFIELL